MLTASTILGAAFLTPALFYGGAAAVSVPILIHLLARRRFKRIRWAAMDFLIDAERRNRRRIRMEEWLLLALRCLAVLLIAMLVARPLINPAGAAIFGGSQRTERVFLLDDSFSMDYRLAEGTVFSRAKLAVQRLLEGIRSEAPDDTVTILRMTAPTAPIESGTYLDDTQTDELLARLGALTPTQRTIDASLVMAGVVEVLSRSPDLTNVAVYIISDFQRHNWTPRDKTSDSDAEAGGILQPLQAWAEKDRGLHLVLINVGQEQAPNLAISDLSIHGGRLIAGAVGTVRAEVSNHSERAAENLELEVTVGNFPQATRALRELGPAQSATVDLEVTFLQAGLEALRVELPEDALPADNVRYITADVASAVRVLVVNGEPSADGYDDEVTFLTTALRPEGAVFSGNEVVVVDEAGLDDANLAGFHVVVLANVYRISEPAVEALEAFVRGGGGLVVFLGDQVDADLYNTGLYRSGEGLMPGELSQMVRPASASHLIVADRLHPAMRGLSSEGDPLGIGQIPFFQYYACVPFAAPDDEDQGGEDAGFGPPALSASSGARVIARFDDPEQHAAVVERPFGRGRVILVTTTADKEWHLWPDHPTFLPVVTELVRHVARPSASGRGYLVGDTIEMPLDPASFEPDVLLRTPGYPNEREIGLIAAPSADGTGLSVTWEHADTAGIYRFVLQRRGFGEELRPASVNVDPRESDLSRAGEDELRRALGGVPFEYFEGVDGLSGLAGERRMELWRLVLFAVFAVLMTEQSLAWWWGRGR